MSFSTQSLMLNTSITTATYSAVRHTPYPTTAYSEIAVIPNTLLHHAVYHVNRDPPDGDSMLEQVPSSLSWL